MKNWSMLLVCLSFASMSLSMSSQRTLVKNSVSMSSGLDGDGHMITKAGDRVTANGALLVALQYQILNARSPDDVRIRAKEVQAAWNQSLEKKAEVFDSVFTSIRRAASEHACEVYIPDCVKKLPIHGHLLDDRDSPVQPYEPSLYHSE